MPEAKVLLTETARGRSRETTANTSGSFLFPSVAPGVYSLRVTRESFDVYELKDIQVEVGDLATINAVLKVGHITTVVSVSADKEKRCAAFS